MPITGRSILMLSLAAMLAVLCWPRLCGAG
jgi:hypothetical protein